MDGDDGGRRGPATAARGLALTALAVVLLAGCAGNGPAVVPSGQSSDGAATQGPVVEARSPDSARQKLSLALADPCYSSPDARAVWPRCGRWVEESASTARTAATAIPNAAVTGAAAAVGAAHDDYVARGCPGTGPTVPLDANSCIGALTSVRAAMSRLSGALGAAP